MMIDKDMLKEYYYLYDMEEWKQARTILLRLLKIEPNNHWILTSISSTLYEERKYKQALKYSQKAYLLDEKCNLVLYDYANVLDMLGLELDAIKLWKSILNKGLFNIAKGHHGEGILKAKIMMNNCRFRIGSSYLDIGDKKNAKKYLILHLKNRNRGLPSIITKKEVVKLLDSI